MLQSLRSRVSQHVRVHFGAKRALNPTLLSGETGVVKEEGIM